MAARVRRSAWALREPRRDGFGWSSEDGDEILAAQLGLFLRLRAAGAAQAFHDRLEHVVHGRIRIAGDHVALTY